MFTSLSSNSFDLNIVGLLFNNRLRDGNKCNDLMYHLSWAKSDEKRVVVAHIEMKLLIYFGQPTCFYWFTGYQIGRHAFSNIALTSIDKVSVP